MKLFFFNSLTFHLSVQKVLAALGAEEGSPDVVGQKTAVCLMYHQLTGAKVQDLWLLCGLIM